MTFFLETETIASDNLFRLPPGAAEGGVLWTASAGFSAEKKGNDLSWRLLGIAGGEWTGDRKEEGAPVYQLGAGLALRSGPGYSVALSATSLRRTEIITGEALDRTRALTERREAALSLSRVFAGGSIWKVAAGAVDEDREGGDLVGRSWSAEGILRPEPLNQWRVTAIADDRETGSRSQDISASLAFNRQAEPGLQWGAEILWSQSRNGEDGTSSPLSSDAGVRVFANGHFSQISEWTVGTGVEGLEVVEGERSWSGRGDLFLDLALAPDWAFRFAAIRRTSLLYQGAGSTAWSREASLQGTLEGGLGKAVRLSASCYLRQDRFPSGTAGAAAGEKRTDEDIEGKMALVWDPRPDWRLTLALASQTVDSTLTTQDLSERRAEVSARFTF
jgi:hypothetical protein